MSILSRITSFFGISEIKKDDQSKEKAIQKATVENVDVGTKLATGQVNPGDGHSGNNGQSQKGFDGTDNFARTQEAKVEIDTKELTKKYRKDPAAIIDSGVADRKYDAEQAEQLRGLIKDKTDLSDYLNLLEKGNLTNDDIVAGMQEIKKNKKTYLWGLIKTNKIDKEELGDGMSKGRRFRKHIESRVLAGLTRLGLEKPELKQNIDRMIAKTTVYKDDDMSEVHTYIEKHEDSAETYLNNAEKIENNKVNSFTGKSILHMSRNMTEHEELSGVILETAQREGMDDKNAVIITDNVVKNPDMVDVYTQNMRLRGKDGKYRFTAKNLSKQTSYMVDKTKEQIEQYGANVMELAQYSKLSGDNVTDSSINVTDYPDTKAQVIAAAENPEISGDEVSQLSSNLAKTAETNQDRTASTEGTSYTTSDTETATTNSNATVPIKNKEPEGIYALKEKEQTEFLRMKFANENDAQLVAKIVKNNPELQGCVEVLLNNKSLTASQALLIINKLSNPKLIEAYVNNPQGVEKLLAYRNITTLQMEQLVDTINSGKGTLLFSLLEQKIDPLKAMSMANSATDRGVEQKILDITKDNTIGTEDKYKFIREQMSGKETNFVC